MAEWTSLPGPSGGGPWNSARSDDRFDRRRCALETGARTLLRRRSAGPSFSFRGPLLPDAPRPVHGRNTSRIRARRCASVYLDLYRGADPEEAFDHFEDQRESNIEFLRDLPDGTGDRVALHREFGEITLAQMLNEWALHDLGHIRQVAELVRARKYQAGAGPMAASYHLKP